MVDSMAGLWDSFKKNKYMWWYALCFALLGLIDQRRGSALGGVQMAMTNLTGPVLACLLLPSMKKAFFRTRFALLWTGACIIGTPLGILLGRRVWDYAGQWNIGVINVALAGFLILYLVWDWKEIRGRRRLCKACFLTVMVMLALMQLSVNEAIWPVWFLVYFGCFYLIGIPAELESIFIQGMLAGIIVWFFVQQIIAFGFRPYDYVRYRGLYSGETQNGLFYMIVFCAFTGMWLHLRKRKAHWSLKLLCFALSAGSIGFLLLTGGRSSLIGAVVAAALAYMLYDVYLLDSFKHWIVQGIGLCLCIVLLFPVVYGCVRYLPTILHHPVWFEGEYDPYRSIHSYDSWDSEKYISFEKVLNMNLGRILDMFGIHFSIGVSGEDEVGIKTSFGLTAHAAAPGEPGSSPDTPYEENEEEYGTPMGARKIIYRYYGTHLNFRGHTKEQLPFYYTHNAIEGDHTHNMFLQIAFDHGILPGLLFLVWSIACFIRLVMRKNLEGIILVTFFSAIFVYGLAEMAVTPGQITLVLMFLIYYFAIQKRQMA